MTKYYEIISPYTGIVLDVCTGPEDVDEEDYDCILGAITEKQFNQYALRVWNKPKSTKRFKIELKLVSIN